MPSTFASKISSLDSAGAWLIQSIINKCQAQHSTVELLPLSEKYQKMFDLASSEKDQIAEKIETKNKESFFYFIGKKTVTKTKQAKEYLGFVGQLSELFLRFCSFPKIWQLKSIISVIQDTGLNALPIIGLLSFLIGVVLAYQISIFNIS